MISISTLILIVLVFAVYVFITFKMIPQMRKFTKMWLYIIVFVGLLFPEFKGIGTMEINLETYAIVLAGIEIFEMIFKYIVEEKQSKGKDISEKLKKIYNSM